MKVPTAVVWKARKIVLSKAPEVAPLSTAYHCRSTTVCCTAAGFLRHVLPLSLETDAPIFTSGSPSVRCESTTAAGVNRAFQAWKLGIGKTVGALVVEPGGMIVSGGSGNSDTVTTPA